VKFSELVELLEDGGFRIVKAKGSIRYYGKSGWTTMAQGKSPRGHAMLYSKMLGLSIHEENIK
jgi:hypothetical protein